MERADLVAALEREGRRTLDVARSGLDAPVPACPGWSVADVLAHTGSVYRRTSHVVAHGCTERPAGRDWYEQPPAGAALLDWFAAAHDTVVGHLRAVDPGRPLWSFHDPRATAAFWHRRMAQETLVHRIDVETAHGARGPVEPALAVDGVDEVLEVFVAPFLSARGTGGEEATAHLHATDAAGEWLLELGPDGVAVDRRHAKGDVAARGTAADLLLWLWGRGSLDSLQVFGDTSVLERFRAAVAGGLG